VFTTLVKLCVGKTFWRRTLLSWTSNDANVSSFVTLCPEKLNDESTAETCQVHKPE